MADDFFYKVAPNAPEQGPIDAKSLKQLAASGELSPESVLRRGSGDWVAASSVKGLEFAPPAATAYPEAIPVSSPPAKSPGLNLPGVAPPKSAPDTPGGLGSLNLGSKKGGAPAPTAKSVAVDEPLPAKPALDLPQGFAAARSERTGKAPMAVPVQGAQTARPGASLNVKPASKVAMTMPADTNGSPETSQAASPAATNPFATEPSPNAPRPRRIGGGLGSLFSFDTFIGPTVIKTLFYLAFAVILLGWAGFSVFLIIPALAAEETVAILGALFASAMMLIPAFFYVVLVRVSTELVIIFFQIHDDVREMREQMESRGT